MNDYDYKAYDYKAWFKPSISHVEAETLWVFVPDDPNEPHGSGRTGPFLVGAYEIGISGPFRFSYQLGGRIRDCDIPVTYQTHPASRTNQYHRRHTCKGRDRMRHRGDTHGGDCRVPFSDEWTISIRRGDLARAIEWLYRPNTEDTVCCSGMS